MAVPGCVAVAIYRRCACRMHREKVRALKLAITEPMRTAAAVILYLQFFKIEIVCYTLLIVQGAPKIGVGVGKEYKS